MLYIFGSFAFAAAFAKTVVLVYYIAATWPLEARPAPPVALLDTALYYVAGALCWKVKRMADVIDKIESRSRPR